MKYLLVLSLLFIYSCGSSEELGDTMSEVREKYPDVINMTANPTNNFPQTRHEFYPFADLGAWHAHYLPTLDDKSNWGGFTGPLIIAEEYGVFLSKAFAVLDFNINSEKLSLADSEAKFTSYPGSILQEYKTENIDINQELIFINNRVSLVKVIVSNKGTDSIDLKVDIKGGIYSYEDDAYLENSDNGVTVRFKGIREYFKYLTTDSAKFTLETSYESETKLGTTSYTNTMMNATKVLPSKYTVFYYAMSHTFTAEEHDKAIASIELAFKSPNPLFESNDIRWTQYVNSVTKEGDDKYNIISVKGLETLIVNWRSGAGKIPSDGITPALAVKWFNGFWPWDSWKQVVATTLFDNELAKANMRVLFDWQIEEDDTVRPQDAGMIIDTIFYNIDSERGGEGGNWNERNSKPPLSAWALWSVYEEHNDKEFVEEMYDKVVKYHEWWYRNRDANKNGIAEYGATVHRKNDTDKAKVVAAAWDSGLDNAPRFDIGGYGPDDTGITLVNITNNGEIVAYTMNQESVDLNSYLYAEKIYLRDMATILGREDEAAKFDEEAAYVKKYIQENMFDEATGAFYDLQYNPIDQSTKLLVNRGKACETYIPLWANVATEEQAKSVRDLMMDENVFNTYVPLPTVAKDNPSFAATAYWRGPVWLDQSYFAIQGLRNYGYADEANTLSVKLFENLEGLLNDVPINENYNPLTGEPLNAPGFSWSSSMLILLHHDLNIN